MPDGFAVIQDETRPLTREERLAKTAARKARERLEMIAAARRYAAADRTDPFALRRALAHIDNGVASYRRPANREWDMEAGQSFYDATAFREQRTIRHGDQEAKVDVVSYRGVVRP
jgi:hypothetical protein